MLIQLKLVFASVGAFAAVLLRTLFFWNIDAISLDD
jgi:hypothetical protein